MFIGFIFNSGDSFEGIIHVVGERKYMGRGKLEARILDKKQELAELEGELDKLR